MAASDHLSGEQFITSTALQRMEANDFPGYKVGELHRNQVHGHYYEYDWGRLHSDIDKNGFAPLRTSDEWNDEDTSLLNGHHRAVAAMERGALFVPVKEGWNDAHEDEDHSYRMSKASTEVRKPHWFSGQQRPGDQSRPPKPKPEIPGQMSML